MKPLNPLVISGCEVLPLVEGGKGISVSNGESSGAWAATGSVGTFSGVNADSYTEAGQPVPQIYHGRTRRERHEEIREGPLDSDEADEAGCAEDGGLRPGV